MRKLVLFLVFTACVFTSNAQRWKGYRYEVLFGIGATSFLGELGGANYIGTHQFRDLEWRATRPAATVGLRYRLDEYFALRPAFYYGYVVGKDKWTKEPYRNYRNLSFGSNILELSVVLEWSFMKEQMGKKYRLKNVKGKRGKEIYVFIFAGAGGFYYHPTAKDSKGTRQNLRKLHTEGQSTKKLTLVDSRKQYSGFSMAFPVGLAFKYIINKKWSVTLEYGLRQTLTDYIDDVSSTYVDPNVLRKQEGAKGEKAVEMADRSNNGDPHGPTSWPYFSAAGAERGDPRYTDSYMFLNITLNYKLKSARSNLPKF